jgi:hypothetical protein
MTDNVITPGVCHWCGKQCGGTCLGVNHENGPRQMKTSDPAYWMLKDGHTSTPQVYRDGCYICEDPEFAQMGLPLCRPCPQCMRNAENEGQMGHIAADDEVCDDCGYNLAEEYEREQEQKEAQ